MLRQIRNRGNSYRSVAITFLLLIFFISSLDFCRKKAVVSETWPTYRHDNSRSGFSPVDVAPPLQKKWLFHPAAAPEPAWPAPGEEMQRFQMDNAHHAIASGDTVYFGSSVDNSLYALNLDSGKIRWTFTTDGPVRYAPTLSNSRIYSGSDDGFVYCLNALNGKLIWKFRAGPVADRVIGNGRMISLWPVRTNILVDDGTAYFAAGVFPYEGIYVCALDAASGRIIWKNDTIGDREHELAFGGISPQSYLVATDNILYVPSSRAMPAAFDRNSGEFLHYLDPGGKTGGSWALLDRDHLIAGVDRSGTPAKVAYDDSGRRQEDMHVWFPGIDLVVTPDTSFTLTGEGIFALNREQYLNLQKDQVRAIRQKRDTLRARIADISKRLNDPSADSENLEREREQMQQMVNELTMVEELLKPEMFRWNYPAPDLSTIILAGRYLFAGGENTIIALNAQTGIKEWTADIEGSVRGLTAAENNLLVSTDRGDIICFSTAGDGSVPITEPAESGMFEDGGEPNEDAGKTAAELLKRTGLDRGWALLLGEGSGKLAVELAGETAMKVIVLVDVRYRDGLRRELSATGLYGHRIVVESWDINTLPDYFSNLIVSSGEADGTGSPVPAAEIFRVLKPEGGTAVFPEQAGSWLGSALPEIKNQLVRDGERVWLTRGQLAGAGSWTEEYGNPGNTACSGDELVKGPLGVLWFGEPGSKQMVDRHAKAQSPLAHRGRLFIQGAEVVMAVDAYNGNLLWEHNIPGAIRPRADVDGGNFSLNNRFLYVGAFGECLKLNQETGRIEGRFPLPDSEASGPFRWAHVSATDKTLFGSRGRVHNQEHLALHEVLTENGRWKKSSDIPPRLIDTYRSLKTRYPDPKVGLMEDFKRSGILWRSMDDYPDWENYKIEEGALTQRLKTSDMVFALNPDNGELKWKHKGGRIAHITISKDEQSIYFAESRVTDAEKKEAMRETSRLERDGIYLKDETTAIPFRDRDFRRVIALDVETGAVRWQKTLDLTGCGGDTVASAVHNGVLIIFSSMGSHDAWRHASGSLRWKRLTALDASSGQVLWSHPNNYRTRPVIVGDRIFIEPRACDLRTGKILSRIHPISGQTVPFEYLRPGHTCAITSASASMLFYRSSTAAITDFEKDDGLTLFGGIRPGCWINMIPASGVLLFPEASAGCTCSFPLRGSVALKHRPNRWNKGKVFITHGPKTPVKHLSLNLGALSDMKDNEGTVWFAYPNPKTVYMQNHYPDYGVKFDLREKVLPGMGYFNGDYRNVEIPGTDNPWLFTSGALGIVSFHIPLIDDIWGESAGSYTVRLGFKAPTADQKAQRTFSIKIQDRIVADHLDINGETEGGASVLIREFNGIDVNNQLSIELVPDRTEMDSETAPLINFIQLLREGELPGEELEKAVILDERSARQILDTANRKLSASNPEQALADFHRLFDEAPDNTFKNEALRGMARIGSPDSLSRIASLCRPQDPIMRNYRDRDPQLKKSASKAFISVCDTIAESNRKKAVRMINRAVTFTDPLHLDIMAELTKRLKSWTAEPTSEI